LAGPVVAAAVIMGPGRAISGGDDAKKLSPARRTELSRVIKARSLAWAVGVSDHRRIDRKNIHQACFDAMRAAVRALKLTPGLVISDGWPIPGVGYDCRGIVHGDGRSFSIACASILAKTHRDHLMDEFDARFPGYGFSKHKGYGTEEHVAALARLGPCPIHRRTFAPVRAVLRSPWVPSVPSRS